MFSLKKITQTQQELIVNLATCLFPILILSYGKGHNLAGICMILPALFLAWQPKEKLPSSFYRFAGVFCVYFLIFPLSVLILGGSMSDIDQPSRFLLALPVLLMFLKYPPKITWIILGFSLGSLIAGILALIHIYYFNLPRAFTGVDEIKWLKGYMPIQDGDIAMSIGLVTFCLSFYFLRTNHITKFVATLACSGIGIMASILSGSRGAWIVLPVIVIGVLWANKNYIFNRKGLIITTLICISGIFITSQSNLVQTRIDKAITDVQQVQLGQMDTSVGKRLTLWKSALLTTSEHPIFGAGYTGRALSRKEQVEQKIIPPLNTYWQQVHAHNEYLEALSVFGIIGLIALLGIFLYPIYLHFKNKPQTQAEVILNQCGILNIFATMGYGLTQVFLGHNSGAIFYPVMVVIFLGASGAVRLHKHSKFISNINK